MENVGDVAQSIPRIYAVVDNEKEEKQVFIIEMNGKLCDQVIYILIDPESNYSYVSLEFVDKCGLNKELHAESWLVSLAILTKKRVHHLVRACIIYLNGVPIVAHLNVLPRLVVSSLDQR